MTAQLRILRAGPLCTIQGDGREGFLAQGISASGPMDKSSHRLAGQLAGAASGDGIEMTRAGLEIEVTAGTLAMGWAGGVFEISSGRQRLSWPGSAVLSAGGRLSITPGAAGNYGYLRFGARLDLPQVMGSRATNTRAQLGGFAGRALAAGDILSFEGEGEHPVVVDAVPAASGPIRFIWGLHAAHFSAAIRERFIAADFRVTPMMDRMGVRLADEAAVFSGASILSLVSDPILAGDIQILGDGTPIVLMRDHQPTGGYPRIGTVISADLDRFAQLRPGEAVAFAPVTVDHAHRLLRSGPA